jgi:hypothetical protein
MIAELHLYEWLSLAFFSFFLALAWLRPIDRRRRLNVTALGAAAIVLLILPLFSGDHAVVITFRPFLPLALIPMAYWQTGHFTAPINRRWQEKLNAIDKEILRGLQRRGITPESPRWLRVYLEYAYLFVYPMVPSGLAVLFFAGAIEHADEFWNVILPPAYLCYATLPFLRILPPRSLGESPVPHLQRPAIRKFNLAVVGFITHQSNTFPSGHAAAAVAVALELISLWPAVGTVYLLIAFSIMAGAFMGRYHYALDVLLGGILAAISFVLLGLLP